MSQKKWQLESPTISMYVIWLLNKYMGTTDFSSY